MLKKIIYKKKYISQELVEEIRNYFYSINDALELSAGPKKSVRSSLGWVGCWDRQLHYELPDNPIHKVVEKLKKDFDNFNILESSIRYLSAPFVPHSDIRNPTWLKEFKDKGHREGFIFIIPLSWKSGYTPGTAFFNSPPRVDEPLYNEMLDILPKYSADYEIEQMNYSVREIIKWESPGDLIAWENFQWHSSCHFGAPTYTKDDWVKEFISIETYFKDKKQCT